MSYDEHLSFKLSPGLKARIEGALEKPHSRSEWLRESIRFRLAVERELGEEVDPHTAARALSNHTED